MVNKDANFPAKKNGYQDPPPTPPTPDDSKIQKIEQEMEDLRNEWIAQLKAIQDKVKEMLGDPKHLNISYLMLMLTDVTDLQTASAAEPLKLATTIKDLYSSLSKDFNNQMPTADLKAGGQVTINGTTYTIASPPLEKDPNGHICLHTTTTKDVQLFTYDSQGQITGLAKGVPYFKLGDLGLTFSGTPLGPPPGLAAKGSDDLTTQFANGMIAASYSDHTAELGKIDEFRDALKNYQAWQADPKQGGGQGFPDIQSLVDSTVDLTGNYAPLGATPYTFEASTGALTGVDQSVVESCSSSLTAFSASNNAMNTALSSTVSQNQIALNQAEGQYQSCMQAIGGSISQMNNQYMSWLSNIMRG